MSDQWCKWRFHDQLIFVRQSRRPACERRSRAALRRKWWWCNGAVSGAAPTPEEFFDGHPDGLEVYRRVTDVIDGLGEAEVRVSKSQIAFRARRGFAYVWRPGRYVDNDVPAVLSIPLPAEDKSKRFKSVVHPSPKVWDASPRNQGSRPSRRRGCEMAARRLRRRILINPFIPLRARGALLT